MSTTMTHPQLVKLAIEATEHSYSPYSKFQVGAALLAEDGLVFLGTNVENASYGLTMCAERVAFGTAIAAGARAFEAIAIVSSGAVAPSPCGACRQVMAEFCGGSLVVVLARCTAPDVIRTFRLDALLPHAFSFKAQP